MKKLLLVVLLMIPSCVCFDGAHKEAAKQAKVDLSVAIGVERLLNEGKLSVEEKDAYIKEHVLSLKELVKTLDK